MPITDQWGPLSGDVHLHPATLSWDDLRPSYVEGHSGVGLYPTVLPMFRKTVTKDSGLTNINNVGPLPPCQMT